MGSRGRVNCCFKKSNYNAGSMSKSSFFAHSFFFFNTKFSPNFTKVKSNFFLPITLSPSAGCQFSIMHLDVVLEILIFQKYFFETLTLISAREHSRGGECVCVCVGWVGVLRVTGPCERHASQWFVCVCVHDETHARANWDTEHG